MKERTLKCLGPPVGKLRVSPPLLAPPKPILTASTDFEGKVVKTSVVFNKLETVVPLSMDEGPEFQGPVVS